MAKLGTPSATVAAVPSTGSSPVLNHEALLEWSSPLRPFKPLDRNNFKRLTVWTVVLTLVLIIFQEFFLALAFLSLLFFSYIMGTVQPPVVKHRITGTGITTVGHTYVWSDLKSFYFSHKLGYTILKIQSPSRSNQLNLVLQGVDKDKVEEGLSKFLPHYEEPPKGFIDRLTEKSEQLLNLS